MKLLDSYIRLHLLQGFIIVLFILLSVFSFLDFVEETDDTALGNYGTFDALLFIIMTTPERALWLIPISALLGSLIGLSMLDHGSELAVMRAAGVSAKRIVWSIVKSTFALLFIVVIVAQFIGPVLGERAWRDRALAIAGDVVLRKDEGTSFWFRDGRRFISIRDMVYGRIPTEIEIYEFDEDGALMAFTEAVAAQRDPDRDGDWILKEVIRKKINGFKIDRQELATMKWRSFLSPEQGAVIELDADSLAPSDLYLYAQDLKRRGQRATRYELTLWRKISVPITTFAMVLIAIPFVLGSQGRSGIGGRVLVGSVIGVVFYLGDQVLAQVGLLINLNPALTATAPAAILLFFALLFLQRIR